MDLDLKIAQPISIGKKFLSKWAHLDCVHVNMAIVDEVTKLNAVVISDSPSLHSY